MARSARRHLRSASNLFDSTAAGDQPGCRAVAGYLFGLSGELAVKELMRLSGMKPLENRRDDPYYAHFPHLKTLLREAASGRRAGELLKVALDPRLFSNWDTDMRYAPTADIQAQWIAAWKDQAESLVSQMELP